MKPIYMIGILLGSYIGTQLMLDRWGIRVWAISMGVCFAGIALAWPYLAWRTAKRRAAEVDSTR